MATLDKISEELYQKEIPGIIVSFNSGQKDRLNRGYQEVMKKLQEFKAAHQNINNQDYEPLEMKLKEFTEGMSKIQNKLESSLALATFQKEELLKQINQQETQISSFLKELESQRSVSKNLSEKFSSMQEAYERIDELLKEEQKKVALLKQDLENYEAEVQLLRNEKLELGSRVTKLEEERSEFNCRLRKGEEEMSELNCRFRKVEESYQELSLASTIDYDKLIIRSFVNQMEALFAWIFNHDGNVMYPQEISYAFKYQNKEALFKKLDLNTQEQVSKLKTNMICLKQPNEFAHIPTQNKTNMPIEELKLASKRLGEEGRLVNLLDIWEKVLEPESKIFDQSTWRLKSSFY